MCLDGVAHADGHEPVDELGEHGPRVAARAQHLSEPVGLRLQPDPRGARQRYDGYLESEEVTDAMNTATIRCLQCR